MASPRRFLGSSVFIVPDELCAELFIPQKPLVGDLVILVPVPSVSCFLDKSLVAAGPAQQLQYGARFDYRCSFARPVDGVAGVTVLLRALGELGSYGI